MIEKPKKKQSIHYVDNNKFDEELRKHKLKCLEAEDQGFNKHSEEYPRISNYLGTCIVKICKNLGTKGNFSGYTYIDDMISDAEFTCIKYFNNFDPSKGYKGFSYFSKIAWQAFLTRIAKEKNQEIVKYEVLKHELHNSSLSVYQDIDLDQQEHAKLDIDSDYYKGVHAYKENKHSKKEPKPAKEKPLAAKLSGNNISDYL